MIEKPTQDLEHGRQGCKHTAQLVKILTFLLSSNARTNQWPDGLFLDSSGFKGLWKMKKHEKKRTKRFDGWQSKQSLRVEIKPLAALQHATKNNIKHNYSVCSQVLEFKKIHARSWRILFFSFHHCSILFSSLSSYHFACFASVFLTSKPPTGEAQSRHSREGTVAIACESSWLTNYESIKYNSEMPWNKGYDE